MTEVSSFEELLFLSTVARLALLSLGHTGAQEVAKSQPCEDVETIMSRQAHYISWCTSNDIRDPVGPDIGWQVILAMYIKEVMTGVKYLNKS